MSATEKKHEFHYTGGIISFVEHLNKNKTPLHDKVIYFQGVRDGIDLEIAMQYNDGYQEQIFTFANNINTHEGGTHLIGFKSALTRTLNNYAVANNLFKELKENLSGDDVREGLVLSSASSCRNPSSKGRRRRSSGNSEVKGIVETLVNDGLGQVPGREPVARQDASSEKPLKRPVRAKRRAGRGNWFAARARWTACRCRASWRTARNVPGTCRRSSSSKEIRPADPRSRAAIAGRRRFFRSRERSSTSKRPATTRCSRITEIVAMITALGTGIGQDDFDVSKLRYHKVIIMTDADVDGSHIRTLLLTFFYRQMGELIERGHIYIAQPPLFKVKKGKSEQYIKDERQMAQFLLEEGD